MPFNDQLPQRLSERLRRPLPGAQAHAHFAPELNYGRHQIAPFPNSRHASVLVLLYCSQGEWFLPLTVRPETMSAHAGQVSFPGGEIEPGETVEQAALREFEEELGPLKSETLVLGRLTPLFVTASNFLVTPCVATITTRPDFQPNPQEVAQLLETPVAELADTRNYGSSWIRRHGAEFRASHIRFQGHRIWGATRMVLAEFLPLWRACGSFI